MKRSRGRLSIRKYASRWLIIRFRDVVVETVDSVDARTDGNEALFGNGPISYEWKGVMRLSSDGPKQNTQSRVPHLMGFG